ncbi:uncharacterized protein (TIGR00255 family) [Natranaerovirga pectinivora]|uniref:Uncharacterized protein (TIGR00255 family) n=1 Tax=Natranaerovirga pectinivora TaxID=682400 RepID=A0A4R3MNU2_9FIRM|nr:YicC/YloC family endoribonuclease [Natranaerovirga pectinivora]TCT16937.1 uncharacterized protein (TIGR00255 family) [Natranaerovirga pectinivora]
MLKSMTGFGRFENISEERKVVIEMKSVNHKYCDINIRMPKKLAQFENAMRTLMKKYVQRGKIDVFITYEDYTNGTSAVKYNSDLAAEYIKTFEQMSQQFELDNDIKVSHLSRYPDVLSLEESSLDEDTLWAIVENALLQAAKNLADTREVEGKNLKIDIEKKLDHMKELLINVQDLSPKVVAEYKLKLEQRINDLLNGPIVDEGRIATEVAIFADKACIDEEIVRLESHIGHMLTTLQGSDGIGRKLDFIAQEMNREANTILSKANDITISNNAIELKTEIEKIREQIQNIE